MFVELLQLMTYDDLNPGRGDPPMTWEQFWMCVVFLILLYVAVWMKEP